MKREDIKITIIDGRESVIGSLLKDAGTLLLFVGLIGIGVFLDSKAMQWVGAVFGFFVVASKAFGKVEKVSVDEAHSRIDAMLAERNKEQE